MRARRVHAVLAAGIQDPSLIVRWAADPPSLSALGVDPSSLDLPALRNFAGMTVKVRHNGLRHTLPLTFRFLARAEIETELFAAYSVHLAEQHRSLSTNPEDRARDLESFLAQWLNPDLPIHTLLWDLFRHERALAGFPSFPPAAGLGTPPSARGPLPEIDSAPLSQTSIPTAQGRIVLLEMRCDPRLLQPLLFSRAPAWNQVPLQGHYFCYWSDDRARENRILELDAFGFYFLKSVDGTRPLGDISRALGGRRNPSQKFLRSVAQFATLGIVAFTPPPTRRHS